jgi:hypothetical protein
LFIGFDLDCRVLNNLPRVPGGRYSEKLGGLGSADCIDIDVEAIAPEAPECGEEDVV